MALFCVGGMREVPRAVSRLVWVWMGVSLGAISVGEGGVEGGDMLVCSVMVEGVIVLCMLGNMLIRFDLNFCLVGLILRRNWYVLMVNLYVEI